MKLKKSIKILKYKKNEDGIEELGFKDKEKAEKFVHVMSKLSCLYRRIETKFSMQFVADIMKEMSKQNLITKDDLYHYQEKDIIEKIENCKYANISKCFKIWENATKINQSDEPVENKYCVNIDKVKVRYINPLVNIDDNKFERVDKISEKASIDIENTLNYKTKKYAYLDFNF